jgi:hypothetical protein
MLLLVRERRVGRAPLLSGRASRARHVLVGVTDEMQGGVRASEEDSSFHGTTGRERTGQMA